MQINKNTPLWDVSKTVSERIDWLLSAMTIEEKLSWLGSETPDLERLGIPGFAFGGEAAHGVEARNDQGVRRRPEMTTSFPQPIGMSASWDVELIKKAGEVTGTEARVLYHRHPDRSLSRWAPTVDLERDPRWGRTEEGYGEDPVLTGAMAGAYIKGMQGEDDRYIRTAATLKHFYGNNTEEGRGWKNTSIDPRNKYELYLEPFRRCIEYAGAEGVMTAYNKINGTAGILNSEVTDILKKEYGLKHVVGDGAAMGLVVTLHHCFGQHAETIAAALKAGVDGMSDDPKLVETAAKEAYELGLITETDVDRAIRCMMDTKIRLGIYDREKQNPFDFITEENLDSAGNREVCKQLSRESIILLKNENNQLPLDMSLDTEKMALIGPLADVWYQDWYGGTPPYKKTLRQGLLELQNRPIPYADGLDRVIFTYNGKGLGISEDEKLCVVERPEVFIKEYWGEGSYTFRSERTGKYMNLQLEESGGQGNVKGRIAVQKEEAFDWFVLEIFHLSEREDGCVMLTDRFHYPLQVQSDGGVLSVDAEEGTSIKMEVIESGVQKAVELAKEKQVVLLAVGCNPMINAKEEIDRKTLALPEEQQALIHEVSKVNPNVVLVLFTNYPYSIVEEEKEVSAIITSATGSQDMGKAMAEAIFGICAPAGRLNMTWYQDVSQLPDIDDYDMIKGKRTYRYFDGEVLYPFGYGKTYTIFRYENLAVKLINQKNLAVTLTVQNVGNVTSDEVVQIYGKAPASRVRKPMKQLLAFTRIKDVKPGEKRAVSFRISTAELRFYDVISQSLMVEEGTYRIFAGASSADEAVWTEVFIPGRKTDVRDTSKKIAADHYDDYENLCLTEGHFKYHALTLCDDGKAGQAVYRDCKLKDTDRVLSLHMKSEKGVKVSVFVDGVKAGYWEGETRTCEQNSAPKLDKYAWMEVEERNRYRKPVYEDIDVMLEGVKAGNAEIKIVFEGDVHFCYWRMKESATGGKINLGVAN